MTFTAVAELSVGGCIPAPVALLVTAQADVSAQIPPLELVIGLPTITVTAQLELVQQMIAGLQECLTLGIEPPSFSVQLGLIEAKLLALRAELAVFVNLSDLFAAAGVFVYAYDGATNAAGGEMTTALAAGFPGHSGATHANMLILGTVDAATWTAMGGVFRTS